MTKNLSASFNTGYMDRALDDLPTIIEEAVENLRGIDFDTIVGTGFSGGVVIPALAMRLGKSFVLIRKETDDSHHGPGRLLGRLGERWLFVDDFVSGGGTRKRVIDKIGAACVVNDHSTMFVGQYMYARKSNPGWWNSITSTYEDVKWGVYTSFAELHAEDMTF